MGAAGGSSGSGPTTRGRGTSAADRARSLEMANGGRNVFLGNSPNALDYNRNGTSWDETAAVLGVGAVVASGGSVTAVGLGLGAVGARYMSGSGGRNSR